MAAPPPGVWLHVIYPEAIAWARARCLPSRATRGPRPLQAAEEPRSSRLRSILLRGAIKKEEMLADDYGEGRLIDWIQRGHRLDDAMRIAASYGHQGAA